MTQGELAAPDYSIGYISRIESGARQPSDTVLQALASRLNVSVGHLLYGDTSVVSPVSHEDLELAELELNSGDAESALRRTASLLDGGALRHAPELERQAKFIHARCRETMGDPHASIMELEDLLKVTPYGEFAATIGIALTRCYREVEEHLRAIKSGERVLAQLDRLGLGTSTEYVRLLSTVASVYLEMDDPGMAKRIQMRALAIAEQADSAEAQAAAHWNASLADFDLHEASSAAQHATEALRLLDASGGTRNLGRLRTQLAQFQVLDHEADLAQARSTVELAAAELRASSASPVDLARNTLVRVQLELRHGRPDLALELLTEVAAQASHDDTHLAASVRVLQARALAHNGETAEAAYDDASILLTFLGVGRDAGQLWFDLAETMSAAGDRRRATEAYRQASLCMGARVTPSSRPHESRLGVVG